LFEPLSRVQKYIFCSTKARFLLWMDSSCIKNCNTFSVLPSIINQNAKKGAAPLKKRKSFMTLAPGLRHDWLLIRQWPRAQGVGREHRGWTEKTRGREIGAKTFGQTYFISMTFYQMKIIQVFDRGTQKLTGENLTVVLVEFSALSWSILLHSSTSVKQCKQLLLELKT
jgi:hypothetical protein